ncbi:MAG: hypothetical protein ACKO2L_05575, partial [Planctomycetaceae bacterium]
MRSLRTLTGGRYPQAAVLPITVEAEVLQSGLEELSDADLLRLAVNPSGISQLASAILEEPSDFWWKQFGVLGDFNTSKEQAESLLQRVRQTLADTPAASETPADTPPPSTGDVQRYSPPEPPASRAARKSIFSPRPLSLSAGDDDEYVNVRIVTGTTPELLQRRLVRVSASAGLWTIATAAETTIRFVPPSPDAGSSVSELELSFSSINSCNRVAAALTVLFSGLVERIRIGGTEVAVMEAGILDALRASAN